MTSKKIKESEMVSGVYVYKQQGCVSDIRYLVIISGYTPFLQIESVFSLSSNRVESIDKLRGNKFIIEKLEK